jgi:DNA polymerase III subunit gamma/tau
MHVPVNSRYKIYIIDEVHMLSKQAWNALLKTVEEPPPHVKFIFATTEVHMVLATIISRCQRFDLQPISSRLIFDRLSQIAEAENVKMSRGAIEAVARAANGGMRDAQSLLDQMIAFFSAGAGEISEEQVLSLFGLSAGTEIEALINAMLSNDKGAVVATIYTLAAKGKNLETLFSDILTWLRGVQLCFLLSNPETVLEADPELVERYRKLGANVRPDVVQILLENLSPVGRVLHDALNKQVFLETIILKAMREAHAVRIEQVISRLNKLRTAGELKFLEQIPAGASEDVPKEDAKAFVQPVEPVVATPPMTPPVVQLVAPVVEPEVLSQPEPSEVEKAETIVEAAISEALVVDEVISVEPEVKEEDIVPLAESVVAESVMVEQVAEAQIQEEPVAVATLEPEPVADVEPEPEILQIEQDAEEDITVSLESETDIDLEMSEEPIDQEQESDLVIEAEPELPEAAEQIEAAPLNEGNEAVALWHQILKRVTDLPDFDPMVKSFMSEGTPVEFKNSILTVSFSNEFDPEHFEAVLNTLGVLHNQIQTITGDWMSSVNLVHEEGVYSAPEAKEKTGIGNSIIGDPEAVERVKNKEIVQVALDLFGGQIVDIHG